MGASIGVLALQGAFHAHELILRRLGAATTQVRRPEQLARIDALVMPGGESTTMSQLLVSSGLAGPLAEAIGGGLPVFGTCAGMILLADKVTDGRADQFSFGALPITVRRNGYGRQIDSFETDLTLGDDPRPFHAVFIRAPRITAIADDVEILATYADEPVLVRRAGITAAAFHPELGGDERVHAEFMRTVPSH